MCVQICLLIYNKYIHLQSAQNFYSVNFLGVVPNITRWWYSVQVTVYFLIFYDFFSFFPFFFSFLSLFCLVGFVLIFVLFLVDFFVWFVFSLGFVCLFACFSLLPLCEQGYKDHVENINKKLLLYWIS